MCLVHTALCWPCCGAAACGYCNRKRRQEVGARPGAPGLCEAARLPSFPASSGAPGTARLPAALARSRPAPCGALPPSSPFRFHFHAGGAVLRETKLSGVCAARRAGLGRLLERPQVPERRQRLGGSGGEGAREEGQRSVRDGLPAARLARPGPPCSVTAACGHLCPCGYAWRHRCSKGCVKGRAVLF